MRSMVRCRFWISLALTGVLLGGCSTPGGGERGTKVLMIGNSFSVSLMQHLPQVAAAGGVDLDLVSLYIGGCSLERHWKNAERDGERNCRPYAFRRNRFGEESEGRANVCDVLRMAKWDVVTIQQASHLSWKPESYEPWGSNLVAKIRELAPQAKICVQETWSYTPWDRRLKEWGLGPDGMYDRLHAAYGSFAERHGLSVIPFGTAVQNWRRRLPVRYGVRSFGRDVVGGRWQGERDQFRLNARGEWEPNCDVFHLNQSGEYFQALVWAKTLLGVDLEAADYRPDFVGESDAKLMRDIAAGLE